ncbi:MAG: vitamin K epoxide reductase family protein [Anaerolineales bacterium]
MRRVAFAALVLIIAFIVPIQVAAQSPVVRAVFFYSPTCPHCEKVIVEDMSPLAEQYGDQLRVLYVDVSTELGQSLYQSAVEALQIPENRLGVPTLVVGQRVLVGSLEIPEQFPPIIEQGLSEGGIPWPSIPGLEEILGSLEEPGAEPAPEETSNSSVIERVARDPLGNGISIAVLLGMVGALVWSGHRWQRGGLQQRERPGWYRPLMVALLLIGIGVAAYLASIEMNAVEAVCGPIGDCVAVNTSRYATLFGVLPVGLLGVFGYLAIGATWLVASAVDGEAEAVANLTLSGLTFLGFAFSIYLTFLEPFVIGATCSWCLTSALIMTALFLINLDPARRAYARLSR